MIDLGEGEPVDPDAATERGGRDPIELCVTIEPGTQGLVRGLIENQRQWVRWSRVQRSRGDGFGIKRRLPLVDGRVDDLFDAALYRRDHEIVHEPEDAGCQAFGDLKDASQRQRSQDAWFAKREIS